MSSENEPSKSQAKARIAAMRHRAEEEELLDKAGKLDMTLTETECGERIEAVLNDISARSKAMQNVAIEILSTVLQCSVDDIQRMLSANMAVLGGHTQMVEETTPEDEAHEDAMVSRINDPTKSFLVRTEAVNDIQTEKKKLKKIPNSHARILVLVIERLLKSEPIHWQAMKNECEILFLPERKEHASKIHEDALRDCLKNNWIIDRELHDVAIHGDTAGDILTGKRLVNIDPTCRASAEAYLQDIRQQLGNDARISMEFIDGVLRLLALSRVMRGERVDQTSLREAANSPIALGVTIEGSDTVQLTPQEITEWIDEKYWAFLIQQLGGDGFLDVAPAPPPSSDVS